MHFQEIETKYSANEIKVQDFLALVEKLSPLHKLNAASFDHYYLNADGAALRYREGGSPELTVKRKSKDANNFIRTEINLKIAPDQSLNLITKFAELQGYKHNFTIYKTCLIYYWENYNIVYYVVYDPELKEQGRFIEIELDETVSWANEAEAWAKLQLIEKALLPIGISPARRIRRSLLEMFKK